MTRPLLPAFHHFTEEAAIIGRLLAGYGELEYEWKLCLAETLGGDHSRALRTLFRLRSENNRIEAGDALMRQHYENIALGGKYGCALGAIRHCKNLRNQYAHCHWVYFPETGLYFTNMEQPASSREGVITHRFVHVDVPLLAEQEAYFCYTSYCLMHLYAESRKLRGATKAHKYPWPKKLKPPKPHNPREEHPFPENWQETLAQAQEPGEMA